MDHFGRTVAFSSLAIIDGDSDRQKPYVNANYCVAGHIGLEPRNPPARYLIEIP
jgi:hypothetical protein